MKASGLHPGWLVGLMALGLGLILIGRALNPSYLPYYIGGSVIDLAGVALAHPPESPVTVGTEPDAHYLFTISGAWKRTYRLYFEYPDGQRSRILDLYAGSYPAGSPLEAVIKTGSRPGASLARLVIRPAYAEGRVGVPVPLVREEGGAFHPIVDAAQPSLPAIGSIELAPSVADPDALVKALAPGALLSDADRMESVSVHRLDGKYYVHREEIRWISRVGTILFVVAAAGLLLGSLRGLPLKRRE